MRRLVDGEPVTIASIGGSVTGARHLSPSRRCAFEGVSHSAYGLFA